MKRLLFAIFLSAISGLNGFAQLDNINIMPTFHNPSFAGSAKHGRFTTLIQDGGTTWMSYDVFSKKLKGGIGFSGVFANGAIGLSPVPDFYSLTYSPKLTHHSNITIAPSIRVGYRPNLSILNQFTADFGLMINSENYYIGIDSDFDWYYDIDAGYRFNLNPDSKLSSTVTFSHAYSGFDPGAIKIFSNSIGYAVRKGKFLVGVNTFFTIINQKSVETQQPDLLKSRYGFSGKIGFKAERIQLLLSGHIWSSPNSIPSLYSIGGVYNFGIRKARRKKAEKSIND